METGIEIGYKLVRMKRDGGITPLFINRKHELRSGTWLPAESHPTKGFAYRPFWHVCRLPNAPHLKEKLKSGEERVWVELLGRVKETISRPESQGGEWWLCSEIFITKILEPAEINSVLLEDSLANAPMNLSCDEAVDIQEPAGTI